MPTNQETPNTEQPTTDQPTTDQPTTEMPLKKKPKVNSKLLIIAIIMVIIIFLLLALSILKKRGKIGTPEDEIFPSPTLTPTSEPVRPPSIYATDSAILEIEKRLEDIETNLIETELFETELDPPQLDMSVRF